MIEQEMSAHEITMLLQGLQQGDRIEIVYTDIDSKLIWLNPVIISDIYYESPCDEDEEKNQLPVIVYFDSGGCIYVNRINRGGGPPPLLEEQWYWLEKRVISVKKVG